MAKTIRGPGHGSLGDTLLDPPRADDAPTLHRGGAAAADSGAVTIQRGLAPSRDPDRPLVGAVLGGKYELVRTLAVGGMGTVYEARHIALARRFAVKVLSLESEKQSDAVPRFKREAELASAIGHEAIVDVVDIDKTEDGRWYIVMELLEGEELRARIYREQVLPVDEVVALAAQLGAALDAAHSRGIVHRDLKPENIYVLSNRSAGLAIKVLDFGISKVRDADQGLTRPGEVLGTPYYMAPEQARGDRTVDHRADVFAFGAVVYEALTGVAPFEGETPNAVLKSILLDDPADPSSFNPSLPAELSAAVLKALEKDPASRYQSAGEFAAALEAVFCSKAEPRPPGPETRPEEAVEETARTRPRPGGRYGLGHLVIAFALGMGLSTVLFLLARLL